MRAQPMPVRRAELSLKSGILVKHLIQHARLRRVPRAGGSEEPLKHRAWRALHWQRRIRRGPANGVRVGATVSVTTDARDRVVLDAKLQGGEPRLEPGAFGI